MKKILLALSLAATLAGMPLFSFAAPGADSQTIDAVRSLLDAMDMRKTMAATYAQMEQPMQDMMKAQVASMLAADTSLSAQQKKAAQAKLERAMSSMLSSTSAMLRDPALIDEMVNEMIALYANNFTTAEIDELAAFYRTPVGRKMIVTLPKISAESIAISQRVVMPRMGKIMQDMMQELQKQ